MNEPLKEYMKETCPYSRGLIRKLEHDGVDHVKYDVQQAATRLEEMLALNGGRRAVPTVIRPNQGVEAGFHDTCRA